MTNKTTPNDEMYCECCGDSNITLDFVDSTFEYNDAGKIINLSALLPVYTCNDCEFEYTSSEAEQIKLNSIYNYLNILSPIEIENIRKKCGMSVASFSRFTGLGSASISRWESGVLMQSRANDNYLRLLEFGDNLYRVKMFKECSGVKYNNPEFSYVQVTSAIQKKSADFNL